MTNPTRLTDEDFKRAARRIGCGVAALRAVVEVESSGSGFLADGRPKILFERHWFHRLTRGRWAESHPDICNPRPGGYLGGAREYDRFREASELDWPAACKAASWGLPQILGVNYELCGCLTIAAFVETMHQGEGRQLDLMAEFILARDLDDELQRQDWAAFARIYNGPAYRQNRYDEKLAKAFEKFKAYDK